MMTASMLEESTEKDDPPKRASVMACSSLPLEKFVTGRTRRFFDRLHLQCGFLEQDVSEWPKNEQFPVTEEVVRNLSVTNDHAERAVALAKEYNMHHTKKEDQLQYMLMGVADHRKKFPDAQKVMVRTRRE